MIHNRGDESGLTLIDFMIGLVITGIVLTFTFAITASSVPRYRLDQAVHEIATGLRATRTKAMYEGEPARMEFDVKNGRYTVLSRAQAHTVTTKVDATTGKRRRVSPLRKGVLFRRPANYRSPHRDPSSEPTQDPGWNPDIDPSEEPVTLVPPGPNTDDFAAVFNSRGILQSNTLPGEIYIANPKQGLYRRILVNAFGIVTVERWTGTQWIL